MRRSLGALLAATAALAAPPTAPAAETRYSLAGGCYAVTDAAGRTVADRARMKATTLGRYLLYLPDATFVTAQEDGSLAPAAAPGPAADFAVQDAGAGAFTLTPASTEKPVATVRFAKAGGCAEFPEAPLNAEGRAGRGGPTPYAEVKGIVEGHMHWMAFMNFGGNFNCGAPWHPYGIAHALPDCSTVEGPQGMAAPVQNALTYGNPAHPHDTRGYPHLTEWSKDQMTYTGTYYRWVERVWKAGMRLMVMGVNENRVLCELQTNRRYDCNEMNTMRRGFRAIRQLQDYVDAQAGGPGKGFFQIVTDPFEARRVISEGRMAVVLEIETSEPFDCIGWEQPTCDKAQIDAQLDEMYRMGVRSSLLLNKFDNPLTGVRFDSGVASYLINAGNKRSAGTFWSARTCKDELTDNEIAQPEGNSAAFLDTTFSGLGVQSGTLPFYPPAPHCNTRGLTELGRHTIKRMMDLGMIVNPDHMSQAAVDDTLTLLESRRYSGVISPHGWVDPGNWPRLWKLGGMAFPGHSDADRYVEEWQQHRPRRTPYRFGWGYGADLGGISNQPGPSEKGSISYPFKSYDGRVAFERQKTGERTFDYAKEGVAHYGLYADWFEDLRRVGGRQLAEDMDGGVEAYLQMWERAVGIPSKRCFFHQDGVTRRGRGPLRLGDRWRRVLERAGQPQQRGRAWSWCVKGRGNGRAADVAVLSKKGRVELVGTTARGRRARGVLVGAPARSLRGARRAGRSLRVRRAGSRAFVYALRRRRVRAVAVTGARLARRPKALRTAMRRVTAAKASSAPRRFVPAKAQAEGRMLGRALAGTGDRKIDERLALLCAINL